MSHGIDSSYAAYEETCRRAKKEHRCSACSAAIQPGHRYFYVFTIWEGSHRTYKRCVRCQRMHEALRAICLKETFGEEWPNEALDCGHEFKERWGHDPPEWLARLAFLTDDEAQKELEVK